MSIFNRILDDLKTGRKLMVEQSITIDDIIKKTDVFLAAQLKNSTTKPPQEDEESKAFSVRKEAKENLLNIIEKYLEVQHDDEGEEVKKPESFEHKTFHVKLNQYIQRKLDQERNFQIETKKYIAGNNASYTFSELKTMTIVDESLLE